MIADAERLFILICYAAFTIFSLPRRVFAPAFSCFTMVATRDDPLRQTRHITMSAREKRAMRARAMTLCRSARRHTRYARAGDARSARSDIAFEARLCAILTRCGGSGRILCAGAPARRTARDVYARCGKKDIMRAQVCDMRYDKRAQR